MGSLLLDNQFGGAPAASVSPETTGKVINSLVSPQEIEEGAQAAHEEERIVKSTLPSVDPSILEYIHQNYIEPRAPKPAYQESRVADLPHGPGGRAMPSLLSIEAADTAFRTTGHRPSPYASASQAPTTRPLYGDDDEFHALMAEAGRHRPQIDDPFANYGRNLLTPPKPSRGEGARAKNVRQFDHLFDAAAEQYGLDADYLRAMARAESSGDADALSSAGASGVMQFIPSTARQYGLRVDDKVDERNDPNKAIPAAARYFADLLERYHGDYDTAVAAYNAGPGAVDKYGGIPPFRETRNHVKVVRGYYDNFRSGKY